MRRHVFAVDPFGNAAASDGAALRNYNGALYVTQTRTYASPTNLRIGAAGQPAEEGALVRRAALRGCGDVTVHIIDRLLPEPSAEFNGVLYTNMERLLPVEPPQCTPLLAALRTIKGASTFLASDRIHVRPPSRGRVRLSELGLTMARRRCAAAARSDPLHRALRHATNVVSMA